MIAISHPPSQPTLHSYRRRAQGYRVQARVYRQADLLLFSAVDGELRGQGELHHRTAALQREKRRCWAEYTLKDANAGANCRCMSRVSRHRLLLPVRRETPTSPWYTTAEEILCRGSPECAIPPTRLSASCSTICRSLRRCAARHAQYGARPRVRGRCRAGGGGRARPQTRRPRGRELRDLLRRVLVPPSGVGQQLRGRWFGSSVAARTVAKPGSCAWPMRDCTPARPLPAGVTDEDALFLATLLPGHWARASPRSSSAPRCGASAPARFGRHHDVRLRPLISSRSTSTARLARGLADAATPRERYWTSPWWRPRGAKAPAPRRHSVIEAAGSSNTFQMAWPLPARTVWWCSPPCTRFRQVTGRCTRCMENLVFQDGRRGHACNMGETMRLVTGSTSCLIGSLPAQRYRGGLSRVRGARGRLSQA